MGATTAATTRRRPLLPVGFSEPRTTPTQSRFPLSTKAEGERCETRLALREHVRARYNTASGAPILNKHPRGTLHRNQPYGTNMTAAHNQSEAKNRSAECDADPPTLTRYACGSAVDANKPEAIMAEEVCRKAASDGRRGWADGRALSRGRPLSRIRGRLQGATPCRQRVAGPYRSPPTSLGNGRD